MGSKVIAPASDSALTIGLARRGVDLPSRWGTAELGDLFEIQQGKALSKKVRTGSNSHPFLRTSNVLWGRIDLATVDEMDFTEDEAKRLSLKPGDLLVCEGGEVGRTALWQGETKRMSYQNHLHRLRRKDEGVVPEFYLYWMQAALLHLGLYAGIANRTTIPNLSKSRLSRFAVPVPPNPEQRAIASLLRRVQQAKEASEQVVTATRELKRSLMRHLFTFGVVALDQTEAIDLEEHPTGTWPRTWKSLTLGDIVSLQRGFDITKAEQRPGPYPVISSSGSASTHDAFKAEGPGVIIGRKGSVGSIHYCEGSYWPHDTTLWVTDFHGNDPRWVYYLLHTLNLKRYDVGVSNPTLNRNHIYPLPAPRPPVDEQLRIVQILNATERKISAEAKECAALDQLLESMLVDLMTGRRHVAHVEVG